jgi:hypothetical protein
MRSWGLIEGGLALITGILLPGVAAAVGPADGFPERAFAVGGGVISPRWTLKTGH